VQLLVDVFFEVGRQRRGKGIVVRQLPRPCERCLRERHGRADDLVLQDQILGPQRGEPRVLDERFVGPRKRTNDEIDLPPEANARRLGSRVRRSQ
jgi:hypothetical protein